MQKHHTTPQDSPDQSLLKPDGNTGHSQFPVRLAAGVEKTAPDKPVGYVFSRMLIIDDLGTTLNEY